MGIFRHVVTRAALLGGAAAAAIVALPAATPAVSTLPPVTHVFVIVLENENASATFGNSTADPYLAQILVSEGAYLPNYFGTGHESNDNYVAMVSGQAPNPQSQGDCQIYDDFVGTGPVVAPGALPASTPLDGQAVGTGCVYPTSVETIGDQLTGAGLSWKGYMGDMGNVPTREAANCGHPALNSQDKTQTAVAGDGYVSRHDPFVYFHSIIDNGAYCDEHVVPLGSSTGAVPASALPGTTGLVQDLASTATTPNLSFIVPNLCDDGHDFPCTNEPTPGSSAVADTDAFLRTWVPIITSSPAYLNGGMLVVTFDEAGGPPNGDSSSCCGELPGPNSPLPGIDGPGGGQVGAVVLSPYVKPGTVSKVAYNHYALLGSIEDLFGLHRLGFAADVPATFGPDVYTQP
ncbi:MAG TPA: alkaline phosphatase family protein [Acidimicrobiales bacterium]|nr:alkaline phosphatase family protein [Acidimicrobiales bacterium]